MTDSFDRREFARRALLSSLGAGTAAIATAEEQEKPETGQSEAEPRGKPEELLLEIIRQQYPSEHLTEDVMNQIRKDIVSHRSRSGALKSVPLANGDAPFVFQAYRSTDEAETETIRIRPRTVPEETNSD